MSRIQDLTGILSSVREVCQLHTSHKWSNSWQHGGIDLPEKSRYMFLVYGDENEFYYEDISGLDIEINNRDGFPRIDIRHRSPLDSHSFFFVKNNAQLSSAKSYIIELITNSYTHLCVLRDKLDIIQGCYGEYPSELIVYQREEILSNLLDE